MMTKVTGEDSLGSHTGCPRNPQCPWWSRCRQRLCWHPHRFLPSGKPFPDPPSGRHSVQIDLHDSRTYDLAWIGSSSSAAADRSHSRDF